MMRSRVSALQTQSRSAQNSRRGAVMVWFIVAMPVLLTLLCVMLEVGNLYLARTELHNALEAAAQAAVKNWADNGGGDTLERDGGGQQLRDGEHDQRRPRGSHHHRSRLELRCSRALQPERVWQRRVGVRRDHLHQPGIRVRLLPDARLRRGHGAI